MCDYHMYYGIFEGIGGWDQKVLVEFCIRYEMDLTDLRIHIDTQSGLFNGSACEANGE